MELLFTSCPIIAKQVFEKLNYNSLRNCKQVSKSWNNYIDEENVFWTHVAKIPRTLSNGSTFLHLAAIKGQTKIFKNLLGHLHF